MSLKNDLFIKACYRMPVERTPIWVMRQAGRYLPEYRAVRAKADFLTMCKTPSLAAEVTLQPVDLIGVDAAILFSDILVIPEAMGMELIMNEGKGPQFPSPVRSHSDFKKLRRIDPASDLKYVLEAVTLVKRELDGRVPLIGFSGSPWTLLTYMVEGFGSKNFSVVKKMIYEDPDLAHEILDFIASAVAGYLKAKIEAGVNAVQLFDSWGGILSPAAFNEFSLYYISRIISEIKTQGVPVIVFAKGVHENLRSISNCGADVIGLDWTFDLGSVRSKFGEKTALQGNLDPSILLAGKDSIQKAAASVLKSYGEGSGHIFNLGHGILPETNPDNLRFLVDYIKTESPKFHKENDD